MATLAADAAHHALYLEGVSDDGFQLATTVSGEPMRRARALGAW